MPEIERVQYKFMIPSDLKDRIESAAYDNRRSLSSEIIATLEEAYPPKVSRKIDPALVDALMANLVQLTQERDSDDKAKARIWDSTALEQFRGLIADLTDETEQFSPDMVLRNTETGEEIPVELKQTVGRGFRLKKPSNAHTTAVEPRIGTPDPKPRQLKRSSDN